MFNMVKLFSSWNGFNTSSMIEITINRFKGTSPIFMLHQKVTNEFDFTTKFTKFALSRYFVFQKTFSKIKSLLIFFCRGKYLSEALIFASTNPQYDKRLFIELHVQYMKIPSSEHVKNMSCTQFFFCFYILNNFMYITCQEHVLSL